MKTLLIVPLLLLGSGCNAWTEAQMRLVDQARLGLEQVRQSQAQRQAIVEHYHQFQRRQLDEAFDQDVRQADKLTAVWVVEHRRAYSAAIDILHRQQSASAAASESVSRNLDAIDASLQRLLHLQEMQLLEGVRRP